MLKQVLFLHPDEDEVLTDGDEGSNPLPPTGPGYPPPPPPPAA